MSKMFFSIFLGVMIPSIISVTTFLVMRKIMAGDPLKMMKANVVGFILRLFLYGIAIVVITLTLDLHLFGFICPFVIVFILLHLAEALYFRRLFSISKS